MATLHYSVKSKNKTEAFTVCDQASLAHHFDAI